MMQRGTQQKKTELQGNVLPIIMRYIAETQEDDRPILFGKIAI